MGKVPIHVYEKTENLETSHKNLKFARKFAREF